MYDPENNSRETIVLNNFKSKKPPNNIMYGLAIKLWSSEFDKESDEFKTLDSVVYLSHDISNSDILYLSSVISHLVGDDSLEDVFRKHVPVVKGEPISWDEPLVKMEQPEYESGNEETKGYEWFDDGCSQDEIKPKIAKKPKVKQQQDSDDSDSDNPNDEDFKTKKRAGGKKRNYVRNTEKPGGTCRKCGLSLPNLAELIIHLRECNPEQMSEIPKKSLSKKDRLGTDGIKNERKQSISYSCTFCGRKFAQQKALARHELLHLTDPDSKKLMYKEYKRSEKTGPSMPKGNYQCDKCPVSFTTHAALVRHHSAHLLSESVPSTGNETGQGLALQEVKVFNTKFFSSFNLILQDGVIMRCTHCDIAFNMAGMYQHHMKKYHDKSLSCEDCGKKFTMPNALKNHRLNNHTVFPKRCDDCGHICATTVIYKNHRTEVHNEWGGEDRTVPCEICGKSLKNKYSLKLHVKLVHEKTAAEFPCDECGRVLKSKNSLEYHKRVHTGEYPFRCDECGNGYMTERKMMECKNTHAGVFRLHCPHCEYKTNKDKAYKRHLATHSQDRPYICPICTNHTTAHDGSLAGHIRKSHKMTLIQAELLAKRDRFGNIMSEEAITIAKQKFERAENAQETTRLRPEQPWGHHNVVSRPKKPSNVTVKTQPDEGSNDTEGPPTLYPPSRLLYPYF